MTRRPSRIFNHHRRTAVRVTAWVILISCAILFGGMGAPAATTAILIATTGSWLAFVLAREWGHRPPPPVRHMRHNLYDDEIASLRWQLETRKYRQDIRRWQNHRITVLFVVAGLSVVLALLSLASGWTLPLLR